MPDDLPTVAFVDGEENLVVVVACFREIAGGVAAGGLEDLQVVVLSLYRRIGFIQGGNDLAGLGSGVRGGA